MKATQPAHTEARKGPAAEPRQTETADVDTMFVDNRPGTAALRQMADAIAISPRMVAQRRQMEMLGIGGEADSPLATSGPAPVQMNENQAMKEQMAARVQADREQTAGKKDTQNEVGKGITNSTEGFGVRAIPGKNESTKLMNPAIAAGSSVDDVLAMVNAKGGPQEEYSAIMDGFRSVAGVVDVKVAKSKDKESTERKIKNDYSGEKDKEAGTAGIQRMVDLVRGSIIVKSIEDLPEIYKQVESAFAIKAAGDLPEISGLIKVKNNFAAMNKIANRDMNITVQLPKSSMYAEIQIHVEAFEANKNRHKNPDGSPQKDDNDRKGWAFHGHTYYEASREIIAEKGKKPEGVDKARKILIEAEMKDKGMGRSDAAFQQLTPALTILSEVDAIVDKTPNLSPEEREYRYAVAFRDLLMEYQSKQSQSLMLAEVMKSGIKSKPGAFLKD